LPARRLSREELILAAMRHNAAAQVLIQLVEANVESGFGLVDEARAYRASGQK